MYCRPTGILCKENCHRQCCIKLNESHRQSVFNSFYDLSDENFKNAYLFGCLKPMTPKIMRVDAHSHHKLSFPYFVTIDGQCSSICKAAFSKLHQITYSKVDFILSQHKDGLPAFVLSLEDSTATDTRSALKELRKSWSI
jgi:hypothetical protein